ncbi:MAG: hypothetical protein Q9187_003720 [Circinaria calcarea]
MASSTTNQRTFPDLGRFLLSRWRNAADTIKENWGFDIATNEDPAPDLRAPGTDSHVGVTAIQDLKALSIKYRGCGRAVIAALRAQAEQRQGKKLTAGQRRNRWITPSDIKAVKEGLGDRVFPRGNYGDDTASAGAAENADTDRQLKVPEAATIPDSVPSAAQNPELLEAGSDQHLEVSEPTGVSDSMPVGAPDGDAENANIDPQLLATATVQRLEVAEPTGASDSIPIIAQDAHPARDTERALIDREAATTPDFIPVAAHDAVGPLNYPVGQLLQTARMLQTECGTYFQAGQISAERAVSIVGATLVIIETLDRLAQDVAPEAPAYQHQASETEMGCPRLEPDRFFEPVHLEEIGELSPAVSQNDTYMYGGVGDMSAESLNNDDISDGVDEDEDMEDIEPGLVPKADLPHTDEHVEVNELMEVEGTETASDHDDLVHQLDANVSAPSTHDLLVQRTEQIQRRLQDVELQHQLQERQETLEHDLRRCNPS